MLQKYWKALFFFLNTKAFKSSLTRELCFGFLLSSSIKNTVLFTSCRHYWLISAEYFASLEQHVWTFTQVWTQSRSGRFSRSKQVYIYIIIQLLLFSLWLQHKFLFTPQISLSRSTETEWHLHSVVLWKIYKSKRSSLRVFSGFTRTWWDFGPKKKKSHLHQIIPHTL